MPLNRIFQFHYFTRIGIIGFLIFTSFLSFAQQKIIVNGNVFTDKNVPLAGVSVNVKGSSSGTTTDVNGKFIIQVTKGATLVLSFVGYEGKQVLVNNEKSVINVQMVSITSALSDVVVVAYGSQKKATVTGAISSIQPKEIIQSPTANLAVALAGRLPGLTVLQRSGEPGNNVIDLFIRGRSTLNSQKPLLMVDGVERDINSIDPYEIETISILKDASATAVFGVRGANGVILVTSKRGKAGQNQISVTLNHSQQSPTFLPKMVSAYDFALLLNQVQKSIGGVPAFTDYALERYRLGDQPDKYPVRNFMSEFTKPFSPQTKVNVNVSGGSEKMRYFTSVGMISENGLFRTQHWDKYNYDAESKTKRFNFRSNVDINLTPSLKMFLNIAGDIEKKNDPVVLAQQAEQNNYWLVMAKLLSTPNLAYNDVAPNGEVLTSAYGAGGEAQTPYGYLNRSGFKVTDRINLANTLGVEQKIDFITKGLSLKAVVSYDAHTINQQRRKRDYAVYEASISGDTLRYTKLGTTNNTPLVSEQAQSFSSLYNIDASVNYTRKFGLSDITGMVLFNRNQKIINIDLPYNYVGLVGRTTYAYNNKYLAEFNFGYNGSEQFAPGHQFGFFPSLSLGWIASEESFLKNVSAIDFLKFRFSYGKVGNDQMESARFLYLEDWSTGGPGWPRLLAGTYQQSIPNKLISWEVSTKTNIGIESRFLKVFSLNLDVFYEKRNNILLRAGGATPVFMFGQTNLPPLNDGQVQNKGFEVELGFQKQFNKNFMLLAKLNGAFNENIVNYVNEVQLPADYAYRTRQTDYRLGQMFGYKTAGFFNSQDDIIKWADQTPLGAPPHPGDIKYVDLNGDGVIDGRDIAPIGNPNVPQVTFGGAVNATYKHFDISFMFQGATKCSYYLSDRGTWETVGNFTEWHKEAWTAEKYAADEKITYPRLVPGGNSNHKVNDFWVVDGSYIRLKNVEIGYTLPESISRKISSSKIRVYLSGFNLLTWDRFSKKYFDPEQGNNLSYPLWKVYNMGVNVTF